MSIVKPAIQFPVLIAYLEGASNYTWLHFRDGAKTLLSKSLSYLEEQPELNGFIRTHKTILVNPICVERLLPPPRPKMAGAIQLEGGQVLPVSRRRWNTIAALLPSKQEETPRSKLLITSQGVAPTPAPTRPIVVVTDNAQSTLLINEVANQYWSPYPVIVLTESLSLTVLLGQLSAAELPVFILLDARTARQERLNSLQQLKKDDRLGWIPMVLLVAPTDESIRDGYRRQANSVVAVGQEHTQFVQAIRRIGQFWLGTAALPGLTGWRQGVSGSQIRLDGSAPS